MKKYNRVIFLAIFMFILLLPIQVRAESSDGFLLDGTGTVILRSLHAAKEEISSLQFSLIVDSAEAAKVEFQFADHSARIAEFRYDENEKQLNIYMAGTEALFAENSDSLIIGKIIVLDSNGNAADAAVRVVEGSLQYVYGTELMQMPEVDLPGTVLIGPSAQATPQPTGEPGQPTEEPVQPTGEPGQPTQEPVQPTGEPGQPTKEPGQPTQEPGQPTQEPGQPTEEPVEPTQEPGQPTEEPGQPTQEPVQPTKEPGQLPLEPTPEPTQEPESTQLPEVTETPPGESEASGAGDDPNTGWDPGWQESEDNSQGNGNNSAPQNPDGNKNTQTAANVSHSTASAGTPKTDTASSASESSSPEPEGSGTESDFLEGESEAVESSAEDKLISVPASAGDDGSEEADGQERSGKMNGIMILAVIVVVIALAAAAIFVIVWKGRKKPDTRQDQKAAKM